MAAFAQAMRCRSERRGMHRSRGLSDLRLGDSLRVAAKWRVCPQQLPDGGIRTRDDVAFGGLRAPGRRGVVHRGLVAAASPGREITRLCIPPVVKGPPARGLSARRRAAGALSFADLFLPLSVIGHRAMLCVLGAGALQPTIRWSSPPRSLARTQRGAVIHPDVYGARSPHSLDRGSTTVRTWLVEVGGPARTRVCALRYREAAVAAGQRERAFLTPSPSPSAPPASA